MVRKSLMSRIEGTKATHKTLVHCRQIACIAAPCLAENSYDF